MFPRYCQEQVNFEFRKPVIKGLAEVSTGYLYKQERVPDFTQIVTYKGWLKDTIVAHTKDRRFSYCVFNDSNDSLQIHVEYVRSLALSDSSTENQIYFPVYVFNPGPNRAIHQFMNIALKYQIKTQLGWMNIDRYKDNQRRCGNDYRHYEYLLPGEVMVYLLAKRDGPDLVESRICFYNNCSEPFLSKVDLKKLLPIQSATQTNISD